MLVETERFSRGGKWRRGKQVSSTRGTAQVVLKQADNKAQQGRGKMENRWCDPSQKYWSGGLNPVTNEKTEKGR